jgi:hypothetical protein
VVLQADRGGISIDTEKTVFQTTSKLTVAGVTSRDAGNYTCRPANTTPATVLLIVLEGKFQTVLLQDIRAPAAPPPFVPYRKTCVSFRELSFFHQMVALLCTGKNLSILKSVITGEIKGMQSIPRLNFKERLSLIKPTKQKFCWLRTEVHFHLWKSELLTWALGGPGNIVNGKKMYPMDLTL